MQERRCASISSFPRLWIHTGPCGETPDAGLGGGSSQTVKPFFSRIRKGENTLQRYFESQREKSFGSELSPRVQPSFWKDETYLPTYLPATLEGSWRGYLRSPRKPSALPTSPGKTEEGEKYFHRDVLPVDLKTPPSPAVGSCRLRWPPSAWWRRLDEAPSPAANRGRRTSARRRAPAFGHSIRTLLLPPPSSTTLAWPPYPEPEALNSPFWRRKCVCLYCSIS